MSSDFLRPPHFITPLLRMPRPTPKDGRRASVLYSCIYCQAARFQPRVGQSHVPGAQYPWLLLRLRTEATFNQFCTEPFHLQVSITVRLSISGTVGTPMRPRMIQIDPRLIWIDTANAPVNPRVTVARGFSATVRETSFEVHSPDGLHRFLRLVVRLRLIAVFIVVPSFTQNPHVGGPK